MTTINTDDLITVAEYAELKGVARNTIYVHVRNDFPGIKSVTVGKTIYIDVEKSRYNPVKN